MGAVREKVETTISLNLVPTAHGISKARTFKFVARNMNSNTLVYQIFHGVESNHRLCMMVVIVQCVRWEIWKDAFVRSLKSIQNTTPM